MTDLSSQYQRLKSEIDPAISAVLNNASFINGKQVAQFAGELSEYLGVRHVIPCANGTDALQIALMALDLPKGAEIITAAFSYAAVAEVCGLLGLKVVFSDVDPKTFNLDTGQLENLITEKTAAIIPVHLFGQGADMSELMSIAEKYQLKVIEDNAQAIGAELTINGKTCKTGTIGHISTLSFFPSKNLGCYGDGGAICTNDDVLADKIKKIANHGQSKKYHHELIGINSRLDTLQAAVLSVKLRHLDAFIKERQLVAQMYDDAFSEVEGIDTPYKVDHASHVYHQYTLKLSKGIDREKLMRALSEAGIPSMIYYPMPLYRQKAYYQDINLHNCEELCSGVVSLPIGTDMEKEQIEYIISTIKETIRHK